MPFVKFHRTDDSPVIVNSHEVVTCTPMATGARIKFRDGSHQDVKELLDDVLQAFAQDHLPSTSK